MEASQRFLLLLLFSSNCQERILLDVQSCQLLCKAVRCLHQQLGGRLNSTKRQHSEESAASSQEPPISVRPESQNVPATAALHGDFRQRPLRRRLLAVTHAGQLLSQLQALPAEQSKLPSDDNIFCLNRWLFYSLAIGLGVLAMTTVGLFLYYWCTIGFDWCCSCCVCCEKESPVQRG